MSGWSVCAALFLRCVFQPVQVRVYLSSKSVGLSKDSYASEDFFQSLQILLEYSVPSSSDIQICKSVTLSIPYAFSTWHICMSLCFQDLKPVIWSIFLLRAGWYLGRVLSQLSPPVCRCKEGERGHLSSYAVWVACFVPGFSQRHIWFHFASRESCSEPYIVP